MIRELISNWDITKNISQIITERGNESPENKPLLEYLTHILLKYNPQVLQQPMIGGITTNLYLDEVDKLPVLMSPLFNALCLESNYRFDVVGYLTFILFNCYQLGLDEDLTNTVLSRSLRSFPSYLREIDMKLLLEKSLPSISVERDIQLDIKFHADLYFNVHGGDYFVWSYTNTNNGRRKALDKFVGNRGEIPSGVHILAPFSLWKCDEISGWKLYESSFIRDLTDGVINGSIDTDYKSFCNNPREDNMSKLLFIKR